MTGKLLAVLEQHAHMALQGTFGLEKNKSCSLGGEVQRLVGDGFTATDIAASTAVGALLERVLPFAAPSEIALL